MAGIRIRAAIKMTLNSVSFKTFTKGEREATLMGLLEEQVVPFCLCRRAVNEQKSIWAELTG